MPAACALASNVCEHLGTRTPKLLVIDDEQQIIDGIKRRLASYDVQVVEGYHGYDGIWRGITEQPDAIITDIRMPHADGEEVIDCLQRNPRTRAAPIFVLTGVSDHSLERRLRARGVVEYFTKPTDMVELIAVLSKYVNLKPSRSDRK